MGELCGLRQQVEDAKLWISVHREYLQVYQDMDEERNAIEEAFGQLDGTPGAGPRKGWKGGREKGNSRKGSSDANPGYDGEIGDENSWKETKYDTSQDWHQDSHASSG